MKTLNLLKVKILIVIIFLFVFPTGAYAKEVKSNELIRLHIIANSDEKEDQELKLKVRDEVVTYLRPNLAQAKTRNDAEKIIKKNLNEIEKVAKAKIKTEGYSYPVVAKLGDFNFPIKAYNDFVLPAGKYRALKVIIGEGAGANWWCVMFPPICFVDLNHQVLASSSTADSSVPSPKAKKSENTEKPQIEVRFKVVELWNAFKDKIDGLFS